MNRCGPGSVGNGYGFPSSHSQYMGYFATFLILHLHFRHKFAPNGVWIIDQAVRALVYIAIITLAGIVAYTRYDLLFQSGIDLFPDFYPGDTTYPTIRSRRYSGECPSASLSASAFTSSLN